TRNNHPTSPGPPTSAQAPSSSDAATATPPNNDTTQSPPASDANATTAKAGRNAAGANNGNLPQTGSELPLAGLLGVGFLIAGLASSKRLKRGVRTIS